MNNNLPQFVAPKFNVKIPSTGKVVKMRSMLAKELKILIILKESDDEKEIINGLIDSLNSCIENIDIDKLTTYDIEYLYLQLYSNSTAEKNIRSKFICNNPIANPAGDIDLTKTCGKELNLNINVNDIKLTVDKKELNVEKLNEGQKIILTFKHPTFKATLETDN